ncbi:MAG: hypothetical protein K2J31_00770 [Alistipes sp.]|nr:hypothetical protein [Alistipes sp.]
MKKTAILTIISAAALMTGCGSDKFDFQDGDLLFEAGQSSAMTDAIIDATGNGAEIKFSHVAMIECCGDKQFVIEATSKGGVRRISLDEFLKDSGHGTNGRPMVAVYRLRNNDCGRAAVERAKTYLGLPYDYAFLPDNDAMYCSELVYESYIDTDGRHIFTSRPMTFKGADGRYDKFWIELFESLDMDIPEGVPGTNPQDMSKEEILDEVYRFF